MRRSKTDRARAVLQRATSRSEGIDAYARILNGLRWMSAHRHRVLYIEDHDDTRDGTEALLRLHDFDVLAVDGARVALTRLRDGFQCCLVLLDWRMPGMNGEEFRREQMADEHLARIPVVVLSADAISAEHAYDLGLRAVLRKPADPIRLIGTVEQWCNCGQDR